MLPGTWDASDRRPSVPMKLEASAATPLPYPPKRFDLGLRYLNPATVQVGVDERARVFKRCVMFNVHAHFLGGECRVIGRVAAAVPPQSASIWVCAI